MVSTRSSNYGVSGDEGETLALRTRGIGATPSPSRKRKSAASESGEASSKKSKRSGSGEGESSSLSLSPSPSSRRKVRMEPDETFPARDAEKAVVEEADGIAASTDVAAETKNAVEALGDGPDLSEKQEPGDDGNAAEKELEHPKMATGEDVGNIADGDVALRAEQADLVGSQPTPTGKDSAFGGQAEGDDATFIVGLEAGAPDQAAGGRQGVEEEAEVIKISQHELTVGFTVDGQDFETNATATGTSGQALSSDQPANGQAVEGKDTIIEASEQVDLVEQSAQVAESGNATASPVRELRRHIIFDNAGPDDNAVDMPDLAKDSFLTARTSILESEDEDEDDAPEVLRVKNKEGWSKAVFDLGGKARERRKRKAVSPEAEIAAPNTELLTTLAAATSQVAVPTASQPVTIAESRKRETPATERPSKRRKDVIRDGTIYRTILDEITSSGNGKPSLPPKSNGSSNHYREGRLGLMRRREVRRAGRSSFVRGFRT